MASTITASEILASRKTSVFRWGPFAAGDTLTPISCVGYSDVTFYLIKGSAFGGNCGCAITPMIASETEVWVTPTDSTGTAISTKTADGGWLLTEAATQIVPTVAAGADAVYAYVVMHAAA